MSKTRLFHLVRLLACNFICIISCYRYQNLETSSILHLLHSSKNNNISSSGDFGARVSRRRDFISRDGQRAYLHRDAEWSTRTIGGEEKNHIDLEPYTPRRRRLRINKDLPSLAFSRMGEYFKHPASLRFLPTPLSHRCLFALLLSRREKHFLSTAPRHLPRTQPVNFPPFYPTTSLNLFPPPTTLCCLSFVVRFSLPDTLHAYEYIRERFILASGDREFDWRS